MSVYPNRLRELREAKGLTQVQMARLLDTSQPTVNRHENWNRSMDAVTIERYARFYNVSPYELFVPPDFALDYDDTESEELAAVDEGAASVV